MAARRELQEETGLLVGQLDLYRGNVIVANHEFWVYFSPTWARDEDVQCLEGEAILFVPHHQALGLTWSGAAGLVMPDFLQSEAYRTLRARYGKAR